MKTEIKKFIAFYLKTISVIIILFFAFSVNVSALSPAPKLIVSSGYKTVTLNITKPQGFSNVEIYKSRDNKAFYKIKTTSASSYSETFTFTAGSVPPVRFYKLRAYRTVNGKKEYTTFTKVIKASPLCVNTPELTGNIVSTKGSVKLSWKKVPGATGYVIYEYNSSTGEYVKVKKTALLSATLKVPAGRHVYKMAAYSYVNGSYYLSKRTDKIVTRTLSVPNVKLSYDTKSKQIVYSWKKITGASSYVLTLTSPNGTVERCNTTSLSYKLSDSVYSDYKVSVSAVYKPLDSTVSSVSSVDFSTVYSSLARAKMNKLKEVYKQDSYWNNGGVTTTPCKRGNHKCNSYLGACSVFINGRYGSQCNGFATLLSDLIFGESAPVSVVSKWEDLRPGDFIRLVGKVHSLIVYDITDTYLIAAECNADYVSCKIDWKRKITREEIENISHVYLTRYPSKQSDGKCTIVKLSAVNLTSAPGGGEKVYYTAGERACVINQSNPDYYYVSTRTGIKGWVPKNKAIVLYSK